MKKTIRLTESELINLVRRIIKEDEDQWVADSREMEDESDFSKMEVPAEIADNRHFRRLVRFFENNPDVAQELEEELEGGLNEEYEYKDYTDAQPKDITKKEYWRRKLTTMGLGGLAGAIMAIPMAGGLSAPDILEMALAMAAGTAVVSGGLISTVGRTKIK
jgi:galactokinase